MCANFIPEMLTTEQKDVRSEIAHDNLEIVNDDENVLKKVITDYESWVSGNDPETKQQSSQEASRRATAEKSTSKSEPCQVNDDYYFRL